MSNVDVTDDCWIWTGTTDDRGYGRHYDPRSKTTRRSHQQMFEAMYGYLPVEILHSCDTPGCVKPTHLRAGTHVENMQDMAKKGRGNTAKLTPDGVRHIRATYQPGKRGTSGALQEMYGITRHTVRQIALGETWKEVK